MFKIQLICDKELKEHLNTLGNKNYDVELDDETSVIFDICNVFEETGYVKFFVSAFGQDEWPVNCRFDLPGVIESLPEILMKIRRDDYNFKLDFYEQGIERVILFKDLGEEVEIKCLSRLNWKPNPDVILSNKLELSEQFFNLFKTFISFPSPVEGVNFLEMYTNSGELDSDNEDIFDECVEKSQELFGEIIL